MNVRQSAVDAAVAGGTVLSGPVAYSVWGVFGLIATGAAGGALLAVLKAPPGALAGLRLIGIRAIPSLLSSWLLATLLEKALTDFHYSVGEASVLLFVSFYLSAYKEANEITGEMFAGLSRLWKTIKGLRIHTTKED